MVFLSDWTDESPARVLAKLKKQADYYNRGRRTVGDFINDVADRAGARPSATAGHGRR